MSGFNSSAAIASARRASAADRHSAMNFDVELRPLKDLAAITEDWRALSAHAVEQNVFYDPGFALAAAPLFGADVLVGLVWTRMPRQLKGLFPVRIARHRYGFPLAVAIGWTHPYAPLGTPLVDRDMVEPVIAAWLDHVAQDPTLPNLMLMPLIAQAGPVATTLADILARRGCASACFGRHQRALFLPGEHRADYFQRTMSGKQLRKMRQRRRRLQQLGAAVEKAETPAHGLDNFLQLEAAGWKGRAGTAILQNEGLRDFIEQAITALGREGKVLIHCLRAEGKVIASAIVLKSGHSAWGWKVSYDEAYADYSPGVLAVAAVTDTLLADRTITQADSSAVAGDSVASQLWRECLAIEDRLFAVARGADFSFGLAFRVEALRRRVRAAAESARDRLRRR